MGKRLFSILQYMVFMGAGLFLVWWQLRAMTPEETTEFVSAIKNTRFWLVPPIILMSLLSHLSRSMRWKLLMEPMGYDPRLSNVFASTMVGYLANSAVPRLGEVLKCSILARYERLAINKLVGSIIIERTFDLICYLVFIGITVLIQVDLIGRYVEDKFERITASEGLPVWAKLLIWLAVIGALWLLVKFLFRKYPENKVISRVNLFFRGLGEGFASIRRLRNRRAFLAHTLFIWAMYLLQIYLGFHAMQGTENLPLSAAFSVLTLATLAMIATPGGIGSFPIFVMQTLLLYGIDSPQGKAFGWIMWGVSTAIIILAGCLSLIVLPYMNKRKHESHTVDTR